MLLELFWGKEAVTSWLLVVFLREEPGAAVSEWDPTLLLCVCHQWELGSPSAVCSWIPGGSDGTLPCETSTWKSTGFSGSGAGFQAVPARGLWHEDIRFGRVWDPVFQGE